MPSEIKALIEQRKREELEKLEKAEEAGRKLGISFNPGPKSAKPETASRRIRRPNRD